MPPFQSRSTGARRIARTSSSGSSASASIPRAARTSGESGTDFSVRDPRLRRRRSRRGRSPSTTCRPRARRVARARRTTPRRPATGSRKTCRWSNAASRWICRDSSMPLPKTSPDMSPMPTTVNGRAHSRRARGSGASRSPRPARRDAERLVVEPLEPPDANASPSQKPYSIAIALAVSESAAVPLSAATTRYGSSPSKRTHVAPVDDLAGDDVVGHVEHAADQRGVAQLHLVAQRVAVRGGAQHEAALRARPARSPRS